tara:strand:- start:43 stop:423 length:381 start_codon:yes stop_codon:yes gene_type:complete
MPKLKDKDLKKVVKDILTQREARKSLTKEGKQKETVESTKRFIQYQKESKSPRLQTKAEQTASYKNLRRTNAMVAKTRAARAKYEGRNKAEQQEAEYKAEIRSARDDEREAYLAQVRRGTSKPRGY